MSYRIRQTLRWLLIAMAGGTLLFQSTCTTSLASGTAGLVTAITNELIGNIVYKVMGIESAVSLGT